MKVFNMCENNSLVAQFMSEIRDKEIQQDRLRFHANIRRLGQILAYEISKTLNYKVRETVTPIATAQCNVVADPVVLGTILRAGLPFHEGFLSYFDHAENAFVSAYRKFIPNTNKFRVYIDYMASPRITDKVLLLVDPMLATGWSMELA